MDVYNRVLLYFEVISQYKTDAYNFAAALRQSEPLSGVARG